MRYQQPRGGVAPVLFVTGQRNDAFLKSDLAQRADRNARRAGDRAGGVRQLLSALRGRPLYRAAAAAAAHPAVFRRVQRRRLLRLPSDHHEMALHFAAGRAEHPARGDGADARAAGAGLHLRRAERPRHVLPRQDHHRSLLVSRGVLSERLALRLSLFPLHARASSRQGGGCVADAADRPRRGRRNSVARNRKWRRQADLAGRPAVAVERRSRPDRSAIFRCWAGSTISRT